jgi:heat shock protein HslJ
VKDFISLESVAYPKNEDVKILLTFSKNGSYNLKLDINSCGGQFKTSGVNGISIGSTACTEACCDSPFSVKVASMLSKVTSYQIDKNSLRLEVPQWGFIELER